MQRNWLFSLSLVCAATAVTWPASAYAQSADTGAMAGTVLDGNGAAVPGAAPEGDQHGDAGDFHGDFERQGRVPAGAASAPRCTR